MLLHGLCALLAGLGAAVSPGWRLFDNHFSPLWELDWRLALQGKSLMLQMGVGYFGLAMLLSTALLVRDHRTRLAVAVALVMGDGLGCVYGLLGLHNFGINVFSVGLLMLYGLLLLGALALVAAEARALPPAEARSLFRSWLDDLSEKPDGGSDEAYVRSAAARQERERLARDLHDSVKQQLFTLRMNLATAEARRAEDPSGAEAALAEARAGSQRAMVEMDALLRQLRPDPLNGISLIDALREQCDALRYRTGTEVELDLQGICTDEELPAAVAQPLFRIVQEALHNVARHARASRVTVRLRRRERAFNAWIELSVADDGRGFEPGRSRSGLGIDGMRTRIEESGGRLEIGSELGAGCRIDAYLPITAAGGSALNWGRDAKTVDFLLAAGTMTLSLVGLVVSLVGRTESLLHWSRSVPTATCALLALLLLGGALLAGSGYVRRRLADLLHSEHPEALRGRALWHVALAWLGVLVLAGVSWFLLPWPNGGGEAWGWPWNLSGSELGWWGIAAASLVWTALFAGRALEADRARRARLSSAALVVEIGNRYRWRLLPVGGIALMLFVATLLRPDPLFVVPLLAIGSLYLFERHRLGSLEQEQVS